MYGCSKDCLILIPLRLPQISSFSLSLKCFSSDSDNCPNVGIRPPDSVPPPTEGRSSPTNTPVFPPSSFILPSFGWFSVVFSTGQVLLSALSWCSACTSASEGVFLMYPWRERYSTSTCSFTILFSPQNIGNSDTCYTEWMKLEDMQSDINQSFSSVTVVSDSLKPQGLQHTRLPCPSTNPGACSNSCPSSWSFSFSISPSNEYSGLTSFRIDWLDLLAVQGILKSLLQHHSSKASILRHPAFFIVQLSHPYMTTGKTTALTNRPLLTK